MKMHNKNIGILFWMSFFMLGYSTYAQKEVDSLLSLANQQIYENPNNSINLATEAYGFPNISANNKIRALLTISTAYSSKRDYKKSTEYVEKIQELLPNIKNARQRMNILNRIGSHYHELQIYDKAIDYLDEAFALIDKYPQQDSVQSFLGYNATLRGFIYRKQMNCDIALKYFNKAIEAYKNTTEPHLRNANLSICYYNKGNCFLTLGKIDEAKESYSNSINYGESAEANSLVAFAQKGLAEAKTLEGNYKEAISLLNTAAIISENVGDLILNQGIYEGLSNNYLALKDWENYTIFHDKFLALQNELKNAERKSVNQSLLTLTETKAEEIDQVKKFYNPFQICLIILIVIVIGLIIRLVILEEKKLKGLQKSLKN